MQQRSKSNTQYAGVTNFDGLVYILAHDAMGFLEFAQTSRPHINLVKKHFLTICHSGIQEPLARHMVEIAVRGNVITDLKAFTEICESNEHMNALLMADERFAHFANEMKVYRSATYLSNLFHFHHAGQKKKTLAQPSVKALDLMIPEKLKPKKRSQLQEPLKTSLSALLDVHPESVNEKFIARTFPTAKSFFEETMYGRHGFYSSGKVDFNKDFQTYASVSENLHAFSMAFAYQLFCIRKNLIDSKKLKSDGPFNVLECGAGNGRLCLEILTRIKEMAALDPDWEQLNNTIHYLIVEKSFELCKRQARTLQAQHIAVNKTWETVSQDQSKVSIICADACSLNGDIIEEPIAVVFSNELPDMFAPQLIHLNNNGDYVAINYVFTIKADYLRPFIDLARIKELQDKSKELYGRLKFIMPNFDEDIHFRLDEDVIYLSEKDLFAIIPEISRETLRLSENQTLFGRIIVNNVQMSFYSDIENFLKRHPDFNTNNPYDSMAEVNIYRFLHSVNLILMEGGEIITCDYGHNTFQAIQAFKVFNKGRVHSSIAFDPSNEDITHDVNFTVLAEEGNLFNLRPLFFGHQNQLPIDFPTLSFQEKSKYIEHTSQKRFYFLVQRKESASYVHDEGNDPIGVEGRFVGQSIPVTHRQLFQANVNQAMLFHPRVQLVREAEKLCKGKADVERYLNAIKQKEYGLALRLACSWGNKPLVHLLLPYVSVLKIDLNERSSNGNTALDWLEKAQISHSLKSSIRSDLKKAIEEQEKAREIMRELTQISGQDSEGPHASISCPKPGM